MVKMIEVENIDGMNAFNKAGDTDMKAINSSNDEIVANNTKYEVEPPEERIEFERIDDKDVICCDESVEGKLPLIPNGGWGWVVVLSAFIVTACSNGVVSSFGFFYEKFREYFDAPFSNISLIGTLFSITSLFSGPIMSALVDRYGCRNMTIIAGLLSGCAFLLSAFSNSIAMLCLTFGVMYGLAVGIVRVTAIVSVILWFDKRINLAVSLASCGITFGLLIYSPLTQYLLKVYDWRHVLMLLSGNLLIMCVCGILMRKPEWLEIKQEREQKLSKIRSKRSADKGLIPSRSLGEEQMRHHRSEQTTQPTIDFKMVMFNLSHLILSMWSDIPYLVLGIYLRIEGNIMVTILNIACCVGNVALGWAGDQPWINVTKTYAICLIICGLSIAAYPLFITSYWSLAVLSAIFGFFFASSFSYTPAILMELVPIEHFTNAYGVLLLIRGIGHLVGPPIVGVLIGFSRSGFHWMCYVGGICLVISGCCVGVIAFMKNKRRLYGAAPLHEEAKPASSDAGPVEVCNNFKGLTVS